MIHFDTLLTRGRGAGILQCSGIIAAVLVMLSSCDPTLASSQSAQPSIFSPRSGPAHSISSIAWITLVVTATIFVVVAGLLLYAIVRYRRRPTDDDSEPPQIFGSTQIELSWTIIPVLIVTVLFLTTARVTFDIQNAPKPKSALDVTVVGHQFWWEIRYPAFQVTTANELHVPVSSPSAPAPTFIKLTSADVIHSFWVPQLAGKVDLFPNQINEMWISPEATGLYEGQCAQFCGTEHAKMLLRVYADTPEGFAAWIRQQQAPAFAPSSDAAEHGRKQFESQACINCHTVTGTVANGRFGPDLTHLMSRDTLASGATSNTPENLARWVDDPDTFKHGSLMPSMHLTSNQVQQITAYLVTLK
jgi:cytochrome c oxidase subunit II